MSDIGLTSHAETDPKPPTPENATMLQAFEWYVPDDQKHWDRLTGAVPKLRAIGITNMWIPPACKGTSQKGNGYDIYDLYDLGEFNQKGGVGTKWGEKAALLRLRDAAKMHGVGLYFDAVLNHKAGADRPERCRVVEVDPGDRTKAVSDAYEIEAWVGFDFPGRGDKYSSQKYHWYHFSGTDYNNENKKNAVYKILGDNKDWSQSVDNKEKGNFDYLMFADLDYNHPEVKEDVKRWGVWVAKELGLSGIRFDAIRHFSENFLREFIAHLDAEIGPNWFFVGEFWQDSLQGMQEYLQRMGHKFSVFDAPLLYNFNETSKNPGADLRRIYEGTLVKVEPVNAVTLVQNHDTQPYQALEAVVADFFKPLAYALILLRLEGYPCVFFGDLYGIKGEHPLPPSCSGALPELILARKLYSYGDQDDYFDYPTCIGWVRRGTHDKPDGCAVVISNADKGNKRMFVGTEHKGQIWTDVLGWSKGEVVVKDDGFGEFSCEACSVSVWVNKDAKGRDLFGKFDGKIYD